MSRAVQPLVERALREWPATRDSDRKLILAVWHLQNPNYVDNFKQFFLSSAASPETIRRLRQKLQEQGKYPASPAVDKARFKKFSAVRNYGSYSPQLLDETL